MDTETAPRAARPRLNPYTKAERRERILARLRLGWTHEKIAQEEGVSERRIRQIVADAMRREELDDPSDHALLQLMRLESPHALAAEAVDAGDLGAIGPLLSVLDRIDRYRRAGARKAAYDAAARERLFAKLNRLAASFDAGKARAAAEP
jgi:predicted transcriptional regulator